MADRLRAPENDTDTTRIRTVRSIWMAACTLGLLVASCADDRSADGAESDGEELYADNNCAACHGLDLRGTGVGPSLLSVIYEPDQLPDESIRDAINNGVPQHNWQFGPMLAVAGVDDDEITAIITYIRDVQEREGFEPYPPE